MDERPNSRIVVHSRGPHNFVISKERHVMKGKKWKPEYETLRGPQWGETREDAMEAARKISIEHGLGPEAVEIDHIELSYGRAGERAEKRAKGFISRG